MDLMLGAGPIYIHIKYQPGEVPALSRPRQTSQTEETRIMLHFPFYPSSVSLKENRSEFWNSMHEELQFLMQVHLVRGGLL